MGAVQILNTTTRNPITLIGERAGICWGADTTDAAANYKRGWDCITSGHGRTLEFVNVEIALRGYSARVLREWYTHIGCLPARLQESTRYVDYRNFDYIVPRSIDANREAFGRYVSAMDTLRRTAGTLEKLGIPREDVAYLLPLGMESLMVDKRNLRNLIDMSRQRMCNRALWEFRELFHDIRYALGDYSDEWKTIVETQMHSKCFELGYCPEKHGCGKYLPKGDA